VPIIRRNNCIYLLSFLYLQYLLCFKASKITNDRTTVISDRSMNLIVLFVFLVITEHSYMEFIYSEPSTNEASAMKIFCLLHLWYTEHLSETDRRKSQLTQKSLSRCHHMSHVGGPGNEPMCQGRKPCVMTWWQTYTPHTLILMHALSFSHHHKHPGMGHLARSVSRVKVTLSIVSLVSQLFSFRVDCKGMI
jgi:hypothetical protein